MSVYFGKEQLYLPVVKKAAGKYNVPVSLVLAHIKQESGFNPKARLDEKTKDGKTWDSSFGMLQLLLGTAKTLDPNATAEKLLNVEYNVDLGTRLIAKNLDRYNNSLPDSIAAYNAGSVRRDAQGRYVNSRGVPNVQNYVNKVSKNYNEYTKWLNNGAKLIDPISINPMLIAGFATVLIITIISGGVYAGRKNYRTLKG